MKKFYLLILLMPLNLLFAQNLDWAKNVGGTGTEVAMDITIDANNNTYVAGYFNGTVDFDPSSNVVNGTSNGGNDIFVLKLDSVGNFVWVRTYGDTGNDIGRSIFIDNSGNVIVSGTFEGSITYAITRPPIETTSNGGLDAFVIGLSSNGTIYSAVSIGGNQDDFIYDSAIDSNGDYLFCGRFSGTADLNPSSSTQNYTAGGQSDAFVIKLTPSSSDPALTWAKQFTGSSQLHPSFGRAVAVDSNNNVFVGGEYYGTTDFDPGTGAVNKASNNWLSDIFLVKLNSSGVFNYVKTVNGGASIPEGEGLGLSALTIDGNDNVIACGNFDGTVDFDPNTGTSNQTSFSQFQSLYLWKLTNAGSFVWVKNFQGNSNTVNAFSVVHDVNNNLYMSGRFTNNLALNPGSTQFFSSAGNYDAFIVKISESGAHNWSRKFGSSGIDYARNSILKDNKIYQVGAFSNTVDFDLQSSTFNLSSNGSEDVFIQTLTENSLGTNDFSSASITIYPNPTTQYILVNGVEEFDYHVFTLQGKEMLTGSYISGETKIDTSSLYSGIYLIDISTKDGAQKMSYKIVKE